MKTKQISSIAATLMLGAALASAQTESNFTFTVNQGVPVANANGLMTVGSVAQMPGTISDVTVSLDLAGGFNGNLYAFLSGPNGGFSVLLNRVGVSNSASAFGYADSGFNIILSDTAANGDIHYYENVLNPAGGQLTGTWMPDGRNIDPMSAPSAFLSAGQTALLNSFDGTNPNGTWTLFVADLAAGSQPMLINWDLDITVPEPAFWAIGLLGALLLALTVRRRKAAI